MSCYTYSAGYDLSANLTLGGGQPTLDATRSKAREALAYYAQPSVRGQRGPAVAEVTLHCEACGGDGLIVDKRDKRKPEWARRTVKCEACAGCGATWSEVVRSIPGGE